MDRVLLSTSTKVNSVVRVWNDMKTADVGMNTVTCPDRDSIAAIIQRFQLMPFPANG